MISQCCWMLRNGQMCDKKVAILALKGLGYWDNAEELEEKMEGGKTDYTFHQIDTTVEDVLERRLEKKEQGSKPDTVADESAGEAENIPQNLLRGPDECACSCRKCLFVGEIIFLHHTRLYWFDNRYSPIITTYVAKNCAAMKI